MSSQQEIKRQYRKLAHLYHPDKNPHDKYAIARFQDIKEAYETLTHPAKKEAWLQERWLRQVYNQPYAEKNPLTPYSILDKVLKLDRYVATQDVFRMDQVGIADRLMNIVSDENINCLKEFKENEINRTIVQYLLSASAPIELKWLTRFWPKLESIAADDAQLLNDIRSFYKKKKNKTWKDTLTIPLAMLITLMICLLIYFVSH